LLNESEELHQNSGQHYCPDEAKTGMTGHFEFCILNFELISWQALYCTMHQTTELPPQPPRILASVCAG
jgi:hypothetical protein